jgi:tetratricopeptide (TPR) repeat protein
MAVTQEQLDVLWDFSDPVASEQRFLAAGDDAELRTQVARALGLQGRFDEGEAVLAEITDETPAVRVRVILERGRLLNSAGSHASATLHFAEAARLAEDAGLLFLAIDAVHMLAIADRAHAAAHTARGISLVERAAEPRTRRWRISLLNNEGWRLFDDGEVAAALRSFELAAEAATVFGTGDQRFWARWAIARALRELGDLAQARSLQTALLAERPDDEDVHAELRILGASRG